MGNTRATADTAVGGRSVRSFGYVALLIVGSAVAFATTSTTGFMGDDFESTLSVIKPGPRLDWLTSVGAGGHVRPVLWASVWANHAAFGLTPLGWHAVNMSLHAVTAWLVAVLAGALVEQGGVEADHPTTHTVRRVAPPLAGLVFLLSPVHAGPVSWIAARADLLLAPLCIVSLLGWIRSRDRRGPWLGLSYAAFALALFTKESAMTFPLVLVAYEVWFPRPFVSRYASLRRSAGRLISVGVILGAYLVHLATADAGFLEHQGRNLRSDGLDAVRSGLQTLVRSVFPSMPPTGWALVVLLTLAGLAWWTVVWHRAWKRGERLLWGETLGFLASAMVASVLPTARLGTSLTTPGGGRFAYLPSVFAAIAVALALALLMARIPRLGTAAVTTVLLGSAIALVASNQTYVRAGEVTARLSDDQAQWPKDGPITVLVAPDTIGGAWIGRNRSPSDLILVHNWTDQGRYTEVSSFTMSGPKDTVTASRGTCPWCVRLELDAPDARFALPDLSDVPTDPTAPLPHVIAMDDRSIDIELDPTVDPETLWFFSGGHLVPLELPVGA